MFFSDSLSALQAIEEGDLSPLVQDIMYLNYMLLSKGVLVNYCWIPSHVGISGNEVVDTLAKESLSMDSISCVIPKGFKDIYPVIDKLFLRKWQEKWNIDRTGRFYFLIEPNVSLKCKYSDPNKCKQTTLTRLRLGKCLLNDVLHIMKKHPTGLCNACLVPETVNHYLLQCTEFEDQRIILGNALAERGFAITATNLLRSKNLYDIIWEYVMFSERNL